MPKDNTSTILRHDTDTDEGFLPSTGKSAIVPRPRKPRKEPSYKADDGRGRRSWKEVLADKPTDATKAVYIEERIAAAEDLIQEYLAALTPGARTIVLRDRPTLYRYVEDQ